MMMDNILLNRLFVVLPVCVCLLLTACEQNLTGSQTKIDKNSKDSSFYYPFTGPEPAGKDVHTVYVPVYSNVFRSGGGSFNMAVTLLIRNTDFAKTLIISTVQYYDTSGELVQEYLKKPHVLAPMASTHFLVDKTDMRGGVGANFIVGWSSEDPEMNLPIIEAVMVGINGTQGIGFKSKGLNIRK